MNIQSKFIASIKILCVLISIAFPSLVLAAVIEVGPGKPYANPQAASLIANPGDTILIFPSMYSGGNFISNLHGNEFQYIYIIGVDPETVIFQSGSQGLHFSDVSYIHIEGLSFTGHTGNGMNIDDGGSFETPTHHINVVDCHFYDMGAQGNNDFLKMSGIDYFMISGCSFINGATGGSGIDMVGCHEGQIIACSFQDMGSNCIQAKGGTQFIEITQNRFEDGGQRALNLGGSTGLQFFRPQDAPFEAADINVYANVFIRGWAPIAFVGSVRVHVVNNTIIYPENWILRILQETVDVSRFLPCGDNSFINNIIYFNNSISTHVNIGPNTNAVSFEFKNNLWYNQDNPSNSSPNLPSAETNRISGTDPLFLDIASNDFNLTENSPAIDNGVLTNFTMDYEGKLVPLGIGVDIGAYEFGVISGVNNISKKSNVLIFPVPCKSFCYIESESIGLKQLSIFDANGANVTNQITMINPRKNIIKLNLVHLKLGVYYIVTPSFSRKIVKI